MSELTRRVAVPLALILLVVSGIIHTVIPRPADLSDWRLWLWFDQKYGVETFWYSGRITQYQWWANRITRASSTNHQGTPVWEVDWQWPDHWTVRAHVAGVRWQELTGAFTDMKREMFGVTIGAGSIGVTDGPLELVGSKVDVFSGLIRQFGIEVTPFLLSRRQTYVWLFDAELGRMIPVSVENAAKMGYELRLLRGVEPPPPLIEPPSGPALQFQQSRHVPHE